MQQSNRRKKILAKLTALLACGLLGFSSFAQGNDINQSQKQIKQQESKIAELNSKPVLKIKKAKLIALSVNYVKQN